MLRCACLFVVVDCAGLLRVGLDARADDGAGQLFGEYSKDSPTGLFALERYVVVAVDLFRAHPVTTTDDWPTRGLATDDWHRAEDILHVRLQTIGVTEHQFDINLGGTNYNWLLYDVGGAVRALSLFPFSLCSM